MKYQYLLLGSISLMSLATARGQTDSLSESFNDLCGVFGDPNRKYTVTYDAANGITWEVQTYYMPSAGGIDDGGMIVSGSGHCGSLYWTLGRSGYARAFLEKGIGELSFQVLSGGYQKDGYVKVLINGELIGETEPIEGYRVETYTFRIDNPGALILELQHGIREGSLQGGILVDNLSWTSETGGQPFLHVEALEDYNPSMDTLRSPLDTMKIKIDTRGCVTLNGEFFDYLGLADEADICLGSVLEMNPTDSVNIYCWGYVAPLAEPSGGDLPVFVHVPVNNEHDTINFNSIEDGDWQEVILSFRNGNIARDLVVFKINRLQHEYQIQYAYDFFPQETADLDNREVGPFLEFFPNPVNDHAWFRTQEELKNYEVLDMNGRVYVSDLYPQHSAQGYYQLNLENLSPGVWIFKTLYKSGRTDALKIIIE